MRRKLVLLLICLGCSFHAHCQVWSSVDTYNGGSGEIEVLKCWGDSLFIFGHQQLDGFAENYGAHIWNGSEIVPFGLADVQDDMLDIESFEGDTYVCGAFVDYNDEYNKIFRFSDGEVLGPVGLGSCDINGAFVDMTKFQGDLIACSTLDDIDCQEQIDWMAMSKWDGEEWSTIGGIWDGGGPQPSKMIEFDGKLYVVGRIGFISQDNDFETLIDASNIVSWDGSEWDQPLDGVNGWIHDAVVSDDGTQLFVAGTFNQAGGTSCSNVAVWNGVEWNAVGSELQGTVFTLEFYKGYLFAAGAGCGPNGEHIVVLDNGAWVPLVGGSPNGFVISLEVYDERLFVGGNFTEVQGLEANDLATFYLGPDDSPTSVESDLLSEGKASNVLVSTHGDSKFELEFERSYSGKALLFDSASKLIRTFECDNVDRLQIDLSSEERGVYIVKFADSFIDGAVVRLVTY